MRLSTRKQPEKPENGADIAVAAVTNGRLLKQFIDSPWHIYRGDPAWVPPLRIERRLHLSSLNPFFKHGEWQAWLAYRNGMPVGRISAQIDELHQEIYGSDTGHFGLIEAENDQEIFRALFMTVEKWLVERGVKKITGPFNLSINQECGLLVEGFDTPPVLMMPHGRDWYGRSLEAQGYEPAKELLAYWVNVDFDIPKVMQRLINKYAGQVSLRPLRRKHLGDETELLRDIFNDAWSQNWGFVPFTREEFSELGTSLRLLVPDEYVQIAEIDGEAVAFIAALPNLNEVLRGLNGSLFPTGLLRIILHLKRRQIHTGRVPLMGVRKRFQNKPIGIALAFLVINAVRSALLERDIKEVEMSWILEDNSGMRNILDSIGSRIYKRYRLYEKKL